MPINPSDIFVYRPDGSIPAPRGRALLKHSNTGRTISSSVELYRTGASGDKAFQACLRLGGGKFRLGQAKTTSGFKSACAHGRNPREALRKALGTAARKMKSRQGAFA